MLHLFYNDANFSAKLLLEPVYSNVSSCCNGHSIHIGPDLAIFSWQRVSDFWHFRTFVCESNEWLWQLPTSVKDLRAAEQNGSWGLLELVADWLEEWCGKKSHNGPTYHENSQFFHYLYERNLLLTQDRSGKAWATTSCRKKILLTQWGHLMLQWLEMVEIHFKGSTVRPTLATSGFSTQNGYNTLEVHDLASKAERWLLCHLT